MPMMVCAADRTVATTLGYVFDFKKNEPLHVPAIAVKSVMEAGVFPAEGEEQKVAEATSEQPTDKQLEPSDIDVRQAAIREAIGSLHESGQLVFTAGGKPNPAQISRVVKFQVGADERDAAWEAIKDGLQK